MEISESSSPDVCGLMRQTERFIAILGADNELDDGCYLSIAE